MRKDLKDVVDSLLNIVRINTGDIVKAWQLIDAAGCRGLRRGGAQVSNTHCNFLINTGTMKQSIDPRKRFPEPHKDTN